MVLIPFVEIVRHKRQEGNLTISTMGASNGPDKENSCYYADIDPPQSHHGYSSSHENQSKKIRLNDTEQGRSALKNITHLASHQQIKVTVQKVSSMDPLLCFT